MAFFTDIHISEIVDIVSTISRMQKSIRFAAVTSECNHCKTDGLFCVIYSLLRFTTMLYTSDLSRNCVAFAYPNICKRAKKEKDSYVPRRHDANKQMWRDFALLYDYKEGNHVAGVIQWVQRIAEEIDMQMVQTTIVSVQYGDKDFFVQNVFWDSLMVNKQLLIDIGANWREKIKVEINRCEQLADAIRKLAGNLYLASGGTKGDAKSWDKTFLKSRESASAQLYFRLDMPFRRWLAGITPEEVDSADYETEEKVFSAWQKTAKTIAYSCAEELAMHAGDAAMVGHEITNEKSGDSVRYSAPKAIHQFRIQVAEIYKKI